MLIHRSKAVQQVETLPIIGQSRLEEGTDLVCRRSAVSRVAVPPSKPPLSSPMTLGAALDKGKKSVWSRILS